MARIPFYGRFFNDSVHDFLPCHFSDPFALDLRLGWVRTREECEALDLNCGVGFFIDENGVHFGNPETCLVFHLCLGEAEETFDSVAVDVGGAAGGEGYVVCAKGFHSPGIAFLMDWYFCELNSQ